MRQMKVVSLIGTLVVIPSQGFLALFWQLRWDAAPTNRLFPWFGLLPNIAAVLCSWFKPRLSAYWVFINIAIGTSFLVWQDWDNLAEPTVNFSDQLIGILANAGFCYLLPLLFAVAMLTSIASSKANDIVR